MLEFEPSDIQLKFLEATERIVFFGGGAGGGKTWSILTDNLQGVHDPAYFSVFFRTTTTEIEKGLTGRSPFTQRCVSNNFVNSGEALALSCR